jgi:hypothetical protein
MLWWRKNAVNKEKNIYHYEFVFQPVGVGGRIVGGLKAFAPAGKSKSANTRKLLISQ